MQFLNKYIWSVLRKLGIVSDDLYVNESVFGIERGLCYCFISETRQVICTQKNRGPTCNYMQCFLNSNRDTPALDPYESNVSSMKLPRIRIVQPSQCIHYIVLCNASYPGECNHGLPHV